MYNTVDKDKPCGFAFVTVENQEIADEILMNKHSIGNAVIDCKLALEKTQAKEKEVDEKGRKIYVGGLPRNLPDKELQEYFSQFGEIAKAYVVKDYKTNKTRGFGFVIFVNTEGYNKTFENPLHEIQGKEVHIREVLSRTETKKDNKDTESRDPRDKRFPKDTKDNNSEYYKKKNTYKDSQKQNPENQKRKNYDKDQNLDDQDELDSQYSYSTNWGYYHPPPYHPHSYYPPPYPMYHPDPYAHYPHAPPPMYPPGGKVPPNHPWPYYPPYPEAYMQPPVKTGSKSMKTMVSQGKGVKSKKGDNTSKKSGGKKD